MIRCCFFPEWATAGHEPFDSLNNDMHVTWPIWEESSWNFPFFFLSYASFACTLRQFSPQCEKIRARATVFTGFLSSCAWKAPSLNVFSKGQMESWIREEALDRAGVSWFFLLCCWELDEVVHCRATWHALKYLCTGRFLGSLVDNLHPRYGHSLLRVL